MSLLIVTTTSMSHLESIYKNKRKDEIMRMNQDKSLKT